MQKRRRFNGNILAYITTPPPPGKHEKTAGTYAEQDEGGRFGDDPDRRAQIVLLDGYGP